jgi:hypothetical protein
MNELVKFNESLPRLRTEEHTLRNASALIDRWRQAHHEIIPHGQSYHEHLLAAVDEIIPAADKICAGLAKLSKPAAKIEIAKHLALLLKSFPNAGKDNAEVFGRMLCEDVGAQQPTIGGLEAACRELRRTCRFLPTICEILTALAEAEASQGKIIGTLSSFPEIRQKLVTRIAEEKAKDEAVKREYALIDERLAREREERRLSAVKQPDDADADIPF